MKAVVAAFNQEKALVGAFSVITNLRMELFEALVHSLSLYNQCSKLITDRPELLGLPAGVLRHRHHLVDDGVHLLLVQEPVLVRVVHPEHD